MAALTTASSGLGIQRDSEVPPGEPPRTKVAADLAEQTYVIYLRAKWMRAMGATEEDISEYCDLARHPGCVLEELENVKALEEVQAKSLPRADLERLSKRFAEPPAR